MKQRHVVVTIVLVIILAIVLWDPFKNFENGGDIKRLLREVGTVPTNLMGQYVADAATSTETCRAHDGLPDHACTPGAINPAVTQSNIHETICRKGFTKTIRPPQSVTT